ncbi:MAG: methyltransferase domain-containing protein [Nitrospiria bacterium]
MPEKPAITPTDAHLKKLRRAEMETIQNWFKSGARVLEIGGGSGYQASLISSHGCTVSSIDIASRPTPPKSYFPVKTYDGEHIPFEDNSFDLIFSSNVLEHVKNLPTLFLEMKRVLKPGGTLIHILPSATWRFWTSLSHYLNLPIYALSRFSRSTNTGAPPPVGQLVRQYSVPYLIKQALLAGPHGEYSSAFSELYYFSRRRWLHLLDANGFDMIKTSTNELFYTGYSVFKGLSFQTRRRMAYMLGASCHVFVMRDR